MVEDSTQQDNTQEETQGVELVYNGPGAGFQVVGENRESGDGRVADGDTVTVPEDVAKGLLIGSNWNLADGSSKYEFLGTEEENLDQRAEAIDPKATSPKGGLTAGDKVSKQPYEVIAEEERKALLAESGGKQESPVHARLAEIKASEEDTSEGETDTGEETEQEDVNE